MALVGFGRIKVHFIYIVVSWVGIDRILLTHLLDMHIS